MGWFIAQSLAFIIIAALIGLAIGIWIGWLVWGHRAKGKHTAEKAEAEARTAAAAEPAPALAVASTRTDAADDADADTVLPVVGEAPGTDSQDEIGTTAAVDAVGDDAADADAGEREVGTEAEADVVAEAEAVARRAAEAVEAPEAAEPPAPTETEPETDAPDDLRRIEGIGPKIAAALDAAGYPTYAKLAAATEDELREAVAGQGIKFAPSAATWADQARYLVDHDEDGLEEYQDYLVGGQERRAKFNENVDYTDVDEVEGAGAKAAAIAADEAEAAVAPEAAPEPEPEPQDLRRIEGIGPKIEAALLAAGYTTYAKVAGASETDLREALAASGIKFAPAATSWADQAQYLVDGDENGFAEYQDYLVGGQDRAAKFKENVDYTDVDEIEDAAAKATAINADEAKAATAGGDDGPEVKA